ATLGLCSRTVSTEDLVEERQIGGNARESPTSDVASQATKTRLRRGTPVEVSQKATTRTLVAPTTRAYTWRVTTHMDASILAVALAIALGGCSPKPVAEDQVAAMQAGLDAFYTRHDPQAAVPKFQKVLAANPSHYGATFQLAAALDAAGRSDEARPLWEKMLALAESSGDQQTAAPARPKLSQPPVATEETLMRAGLDALYQRHDPTGATAEFQQVLAKNPTHYGATFQLAAALDAAGRQQEARPYWEKALAMAQRY